MQLPQSGSVSTSWKPGAPSLRPSSRPPRGLASKPHPATDSFVTPSLAFSTRVSRDPRKESCSHLPRCSSEIVPFRRNGPVPLVAALTQNQGAIFPSSLSHPPQQPHSAPPNPTTRWAPALVSLSPCLWLRPQPEGTPLPPSPPLHPLPPLTAPCLSEGPRRPWSP